MDRSGHAICPLPGPGNLPASRLSPHLNPASAPHHVLHAATTHARLRGVRAGPNPRLDPPYARDNLFNHRLSRLPPWRAASPPPPQMREPPKDRRLQDPRRHACPGAPERRGAEAGSGDAFEWSVSPRPSPRPANPIYQVTTRKRSLSRPPPSPKKRVSPSPPTS
jgi:hypothetical protein